MIRSTPPRQPAGRGLAAALTLATCALFSPPALSAVNALEKDELWLGFIKLTDMAPFAVAYELGYFEHEGLYVTLEAQANWKVLLDRVITGELDGAHMLAGQPLAATIGYGTKAHLVTAFSMDLNGNAVTVASDVWSQMKPNVPLAADGRPEHPIGAAALRPVVDAYRDAGDAFTLGVVFPVSTHNYELRYWLAAGGLHPGFYSPQDVTGRIGADVALTVTPPPQMPANLEAGTIQGYCVGEPWNQQAVRKGLGVGVITDRDIWRNNPEKVFGVTREWASAHPNTHRALVKALIRAAIWLDQNANQNRAEAVRLLARREYVGADEDVIASSMTGTFEYEPGDIRAAADFNVFFRYHATYPFYSDAVWTLTQMRRWGQIAEDRDDVWYQAVARAVYLPEVYLEAARALVEEGLADAADFPWDSDGYRPPQAEFIDGIEYDGRRPNAYLERLAIGLKHGDRVVGRKVVGGEAR